MTSGHPFLHEGQPSQVEDLNSITENTDVSYTVYKHFLLTYAIYCLECSWLCWYINILF